MRARLLLAALAAVWIGACKPGVGTSCDRGEARCIDAERALACQGGKFIETVCRGRLGCRLEADGVACDVSGNRPGDPCSTDEEGAAACADEKTLVACRKGSYQRSSCRGPRGCTVGVGRAECDASIAEAGETCPSDGRKACSTDGRRVLACEGGKMAPKYECRGERGCAVVTGKLDCDQSTAHPGDACDALVEGSFACTEDRKALVRCAGGRFVTDDACKRGETCVSEDGATRCKKAHE